MVLSLMTDLKAMFGINVKYASCENAGKNKDIKRACKQKGMVVQFYKPCKIEYNKMAESRGNMLLCLAG